MTADDSVSFAYLRQVWHLRYLWFSLVANDIRSRYRRSILGVGWSLLRPLGMTAIFCLVFGTLFNRSITDYAPYVLVSVTIWQFIAESLITGCHCFNAGSAYIRQQQIPHAIFPLRTVLGTGFHFLVALSLGVALTAYLKGIASFSALLFIPFAIFILLALGWSLAIISGVAQTHFPDTAHLLEILIQIVFYLTPIMYSATDFPNRNRFSTVLALNPVQSLLEMIRQPLLHGQMPTAFNIGMSVACAVVAGVTAVLLLRRLERSLVFWL